MAAIEIEVDVSGPLFDGRAQVAAREYVQQVELDVAHQGYADVMGILNADIRHPTPYYETQITVQRQVNNLVVTDRGVVYGPWLEGTGSRNFPVTSFAGYHAFRRATQQLRQQAPQIAQNTLRHYIDRMG